MTNKTLGQIYDERKKLVQRKTKLKAEITVHVIGIQAKSVED